MSESDLKKIDSGEMSGAPQQSENGFMTVVSGMLTRKRTMAQTIIDGGPGREFVAWAGGYGTVEEVMEMVAWNQLIFIACR